MNGNLNQGEIDILFRKAVFSVQLSDFNRHKNIKNFSKKGVTNNNTFDILSKVDTTHGPLAQLVRATGS